MRVIVIMREKHEVLVSSLGFILHFTEGIIDKILNIIILNYFVSHSLCNSTLNFSFRTKILKKPSRFFKVRSQFHW